MFLKNFSESMFSRSTVLLPLNSTFSKPGLVKYLTSQNFRKGIADEELAKIKQERGRKRDRQSEESEVRGSSKRMRSASSASISTISTSMSRSPSPHNDLR